MLNSTFDIDAYLTAKLDSENKLASLADASQQKQADLLAMRERETAKKALEATWVGQLGLEPGGFVANTVNKAASFASGTSRLLGQVASLPINVSSAASTVGFTPAEYDAYNRHLTGSPVEGDANILARRPQDALLSVKELFDNAGTQRKTSRQLNDFTDLTGIVEQSNRDSLTKDIQQGFDGNWAKVKSGSKMDAVSGLANIFSTASGAILTNPTGVMEYVVENIPQLFVGALGKIGQGAMLASNVGYGVDYYQQFLERYAKENGGQLPPENLRSEAAWKAASLVFAEHVGDKAALAFSGVGSKAAGDVARTSFKQSLKNTGKATAEGFTTEALTEGYQTGIENSLTGDPTDAKTIFTGAMIGGAAGGGLSGGGRAVSEYAKATPEHATERAQEANKLKTRIGAINTGDVTAYTDPASSQFAPQTAIAALFGNNQKPDTTPEQRQVNIDKADQILESAKTAHAQAQAALDMTTVAGTQKQIDEYQAFIDAAPNSPNVGTAKAAIATLQEQLASLQKNPNPAAAKAAQMKFKQLDTQLTEATKNRQQLDLLASHQETQTQLGLANTTDEQIAEDIAVLSKPVDPKESNDALTAGVSPRETSAGRIVNLAMSAPERLNPEQVSALVADETNGLTASQRDYLRAFNQSQVITHQAQGTRGVKQLIFNGSAPDADGKIAFIGLNQYRQRMASAVAANSEKKAGGVIHLLTKFAVDHADKAAVGAEALKLGLGTQVLREKNAGDNTGRWYINTGTRLGKAELSTNGGFNADSARFISNLKLEADAINAVHAELLAAHDLKFTPSATKGTPNVQNVSQGQVQPRQLLQPTPQGTADPATGTPGVVTPPASVVTSDVKPPVVVGTPVVEKAAVVTEPNQPVAPVEAAEAATEVVATNTEEPVGSSVKTQETESLKPTQEVSTKVDSTPEQDAPTETTVPEGTLTAVLQKSPEGIPFVDKKLGDFFKQSVGKTGSASFRPLVAVKDFLNQLTMDKALEFMKLKEPTTPQRAVLELFVKQAKEWQQRIQTNLPKQGNPKFFYNDPMQYLISQVNGKSAVDQNLATAISYAVFSYIAENAGKGRFKTNEEINMDLGRDQDAFISAIASSELRGAGLRNTVFMNTLGRRVIQALGLKNASDETPESQLANLESALGAHAMKLMLDLKIVERVQVSGETMAEMRDAKDTNTDATFEFIAFKRDDQGKTAPIAQKISEAAKDTQGFLGNLFGVESSMKEPTLEGTEFTQKSIKNTTAGVPSKLADIQDAQNKVPSFVHPEMWKLIEQLNAVAPDALMEIAGAEHVEGQQAAQTPGIEARNSGIEREVSLFMDYVSKMVDKTVGMFFDHLVWQVQRVGIATNVINPQTSKFARHSLYRQKWDSKVDTTSADDMKNFYLRVGEGLGVKTDKQSNERSLDSENIKSVFAKTESKETKDAVDVLVQMMQGLPMTEAKAATLLAGVKAGGENMHSLAALMALAQYMNALADGKTTFQTQLMSEVDGVTNGPMLANLMLGAGSTPAELMAFMNRGGFFEQGSEYQNYNVWREVTSHLDLYETTTKHMMERAREIQKTGRTSKTGYVWLTPENASLVMDAIQSITGVLEKDGTIPKEGRNIIKKPTTALMFGSATQTAANGMADEFMSSIYSSIKKLSDSKGDPAALVESINTMLRNGSYKVKEEWVNPPLLPRSMTVEQLMAYEFTATQYKGITAAFGNTLGHALQQTLKADFEVFIARRLVITKTAQVTHNLYNAAYTGLREQMINELMDAEEKKPGTGIAFVRRTHKVLDPKTGKMVDGDKYRDPVHDLSLKQLKQLNHQVRALLPMMHTPMSKDSGALSTGLRIGNTEQKLSQRSSYQTQTKFGTDLPSPVQRNGAPQRGYTTHAYETVQEKPGVGVMVKATHSADSAGSHNAVKAGIEDFQPLNVHDAHGVGLSGFPGAAQNLNGSIWNTMLNYSPATEVHNAFLRTLHGFADLVRSGTLPAASFEILAEVFQDPKGKIPWQDVLRNTLTASLANANLADKTKLDTMALMAFVDQYALEGGQYRVTEQDRAAAVAKANALPGDKPNPQDLAAVSELEKAFANVKSEPSNTAADPAADEQGNSDAEEAPVDSPFGTLGTHAHASKQVVIEAKPIEDYLRKNPKATVKDVIKELYKLLQAQPISPTRDFYIQLLHRLNLSTHKDLPVRLITRDSKEDDIQSSPPYKGASGWFDTYGKGIFILSSEFTSSYITVETLLHELTHDALVALMEYTERDEEDSDTTRRFTELKNLFQAAKKYVKDNPNKVSHAFTRQLENIHEFIAYGMTDIKFQTEVLEQMPVISKAGKVISGLSSFVETVMRILFKGTAKGKEEFLINGLTAFMTNADSWFKEVEQSRNPQAAPVTPAAAAQTPTSSKPVDDDLFAEDPVESGPAPAFKLNEGQQAAYDAVVDFLKSKKRTFSVIGSAGTGKTTIVTTILKNLYKEGLSQFASPVLTSPTHRANAVTRSKNPSAQIVTLHSLLGLAPATNLEEFDAKNLKFEKASEGKTMPIDGLIIVDESSMINDALYKYLIEAATAAGTKIIFLGDMAQLGPVKQTTDSKALTGTDGQSNLTQVMRAKNAALLDESVHLRESGDFTSVTSMKQGNGVQFLNSSSAFIDRAIGLFASLEFKKNPLLVRVLAFRNATVAKYNSMIRDSLYGQDAPAYVSGDLLLGYSAFGPPNQTTKMTSIANGVDYKIQSVGSTYQDTLYGVKVDVIRLTIQDVLGLNPAVTVEVVSPNTPTAKIQAIGLGAQKMVDAAKKDFSQWKRFYAEKERFALPFDVTASNDGRAQNMIVKTIDYGYAHTIHKSQGGTYTFAMVDAKDVDAARTEKDRQRLKYVGLTRAERGAFVLTGDTVTESPARTNLAMSAPQDEIDGVSITLDQSNADTAYSIDSGGLIKGVTFKDKGIVAINNSVKLTPKQRHALSLHEIGVHYGLERMIGEDAFAAILATLKAMRGNSASVDEAYASVPTDTAEDLIHEEALAYLVENYHNMPMVKRIIASIKEWFAKTFGRPLPFEKDVYLLATASLAKYGDKVRVVGMENIQKTPKMGFVKLDFAAALKSSPAMHTLLDTIVDAFGDAVTLTGSLAMAPQMNIYRDAKEQIHDLDFMYEGDHKALIAALKTKLPSADLIRAFYANDGVFVITVAMPIENVQIHSIAQGKTRAEFTVTGSVNNGDPHILPTSQYNVVDFFVDNKARRPAASQAYSGKDGKQRTVQLSSAQDTFDAKFKMGRAKDLQDALLAQTGSPAMSQTGSGQAQDEINAINAYTTLDIHEALRNTTTPLSAAFDGHLRGLLTSIVHKLHGPFGAFHEAMRKDEASGPLGVWLKALSTGKAPFASSIIASGLNGSAQEDFAMEQVEATVRAALNNNEAQSKAAYKGLSDLYMETYRRLKPSDFRSQAEYDFVFKIEKSNGNTSDYLSRFAALGLANEHFNGLLKVATDRTTKSMTAGMSFADRLQVIFENILEFFHGKLSNTYKGQPANEQLRTLVDQLVDSEAKRRTVFVSNALDSAVLDPLENMAQKLVQTTKDKAAAIASTAFFTNNKNAFVKLTGNMVKMATTNGKVDQFMDVIRKLQDRNSKDRMSIAGSLLREYQGHNQPLQVLLRMRKEHEVLRKGIIDGSAQTARSTFANGGKDMTPEARNSMSHVFMRTGAHNLMGDFNMVEIENLMTNPAALTAAIAKLEQQLHKVVPTGLKADYIDKANALAMYRVTGENRADNHLLKNASAIANMYGVKKTRKITSQQVSQSTPILTKLITLYALEYSNAANPEVFKTAKETLHTENLRTDGNGVEFVLKLHQRLEKESLERVFKNNPVLMLHGYTPEIYDPYVTVKVAGAVEGAELEKEGYSAGVPLALDSADPDQDPQRLYALDGVGMVRRVTGGMSFTGKKAMGSKIHNGYRNTNTVTGLTNSITNANIAANRAASIDPNRNPNRARQNLMQAKRASYMAPVLDEQGHVVSWAYLMAANTKDSVLRRDNRFDKILGTLAGSIYDKESSIEDNQKAVLALKEQYDLDYANNSESYVLIGQKSTDPENKTLWDLLPYETQQEAKAEWGFPGMWVRKDNVDIVFGYRKLSVTAMFEKDPDSRVLYEKFIIQLAEAFFGKKAALRFAQGERAWQDLVAEAKDTIVIKTGLVMMNNIRSNIWMLAMSGVPMRDVLHHHLVALKGAMSWQKESADLLRLKTLRDTGHTLGKGAEIDRDILRLEDSLARNPVKELMEAGLMPTIVEDVSEDEDIYSYKSEVARKLESFADKLNPTVVKAGKLLYMSHDTGLYKGLHRITQLSDFVARYTLYQHLTTRQDKPLDKATAIQKASDAFVNYDIPMHRKLQYLDDMGLFLFTKYFIRVQKVLAETVKENPGRVLASLALAHYLNLGPTVLEESSMWMHIGRNPFHTGPFKFLTTLDDLMPINAAMSIFSPGTAAAPVVEAASAAAGL